jgi:hypothetical protein
MTPWYVGQPVHVSEYDNHAYMVKDHVFQKVPNELWNGYLHVVSVRMQAMMRPNATWSGMMIPKYTGSKGE